MLKGRGSHCLPRGGAGTSFEAASRRLRTRAYGHDRKELDSQRRDAEDRDRPGDLFGHRRRRAACLRAGGDAADGAAVFFMLGEF